MISAPKEVQQLHTRLLKCALEVDDARDYWRHCDGTFHATARRAFEEYWFGARSLDRIEVLLQNLRARFDAFPPALRVLHAWPQMSPDTRRLICHWHLQLSDPLYRAFTADFLVERRATYRSELDRERVVRWVSDQGPGRWTMSTRLQFASKLMSAAFAAGLLGSSRDPRPLTLPRVTDEALEYFLYLLREVSFEGTLLDNPYFRSVGLESAYLEERLRLLPGLRYQRQGDLVDFAWRDPHLLAWASRSLGLETSLIVGEQL